MHQHRRFLVQRDISKKEEFFIHNQLFQSQQRDKTLYKFMKQQNFQANKQLFLEDEHGVPVDSQQQKQQ